MSEAKPPRKKRPPQGRMIVTDGIHFVRAAAKADKHPMRFIVGQHLKRTTPRNRALPRYVETLERGIDLMGVYSRRAITADRSLSATYSVQMLPETSDAPAPKNPRKRAPLPQMPWITTRFLCVLPVNCIAQAWLCVKDKHEVNYRSKSGMSKPDPLPHEKGDYALVSRGQPLRKRGIVEVFTATEVRKKADQLFLAAPPEERQWYGTSKVYENEHFEVHFDPSEIELGQFDYLGGNGVYKPFNIYMPEFNKKARDKRGVILRYGSIEGAIKKADELAADRKRRTRG